MDLQTTEMTDQTTPQGGASGIRVTLAGLPLSITLHWPFRPSTTGADMYVLHGEVRLENSAGLHALVAVQLTLTVKEVLPSLEPRDVEAPVINTLRKEVDRKQLELLPSPKRVPVLFSSRQYDFKRNRWAFGQASDAQVREFVRRDLYWQTRLGAAKVWLADPVDAQYLGVEPAQVLAAARTLGVEDEWTVAPPELMQESEKFEADARCALEELEKKHAYERG